MHKVKLGIVGCGAVTQIYHLPASRLLSGAKIEALVDLDLNLAQKLCSKYKIPYCFNDYRKLFGLVDGVIIALPNKLHASTSIEFLKERIPVLCEKPLATSAHDAEEVIKTSEKFKTPIAVGLIRRFYTSSRLVKFIISKNILGKIYRFEIEEGIVYDWPTISGFYFNRLASGGGVLMDTGSHVLDLVLWWFGDNVINFDYKDDDLGGGIEANSELNLVINYKGDQIEGTIELSRTRRLRNSYKIFGEKGWLEFFPFDTEKVQLNLKRKQQHGMIYDKKLDLGGGKRNIIYYFYEQLKDFVQVIAGDKASPYVDGKTAYQTVKLIEACYNKKQNIPMPWITNGIN